MFLESSIICLDRRWSVRAEETNKTEEFRIFYLGSQIQGWGHRIIVRGNDLAWFENSMGGRARSNYVTSARGGITSAGSGEGPVAWQEFKHRSKKQQKIINVSSN